MYEMNDRDESQFRRMLRLAENQPLPAEVIEIYKKAHTYWARLQNGALPSDVLMVCVMLALDLKPDAAVTIQESVRPQPPSEKKK